MKSSKNSANLEEGIKIEKEEWKTDEANRIQKKKW